MKKCPSSIRCQDSNPRPKRTFFVTKFYCDHVSPGLVTMGGDWHLRGQGFKSQHQILDGHISHYIVVKIVVMFV